MNRTTATNNLGGMFSEAPPATRIDAVSLNGFQEEIRNVIVGASITPDRNVNTQLLSAINTLIAISAAAASSALSAAVATLNSSISSLSSTLTPKTARAHGRIKLGTGGISILSGAGFASVSAPGSACQVVLSSAQSGSDFTVVGVVEALGYLLQVETAGRSTTGFSFQLVNPSTGVPVNVNSISASTVVNLVVFST